MSSKTRTKTNKQPPCFVISVALLTLRSRSDVFKLCESPHSDQRALWSTRFPGLCASARRVLLISLSSLLTSHLLRSSLPSSGFHLRKTHCCSQAETYLSVDLALATPQNPSARDIGATSHRPRQSQDTVPTICSNCWSTRTLYNLKFYL